MKILAPLRGVTVRCFRETFAPELAAAGFTEAITPFVTATAGYDPLKDRELMSWTRLSQTRRGKTDPLHLTRLGQSRPQILRLPQSNNPTIQQSNNSNNTTPQFIGKDPEALRACLRRIREAGYATADLNCGCPFPMVRNKGRGSGILRTPDVLRRMLDVGCAEMGEGKFSVKARLGVKEPDELLKLMPLLNEYPLRFLTVHARTAVQMYEGACDWAAFRQIAAVAKMPLVANGDLAVGTGFVGNEGERRATRDANGCETRDAKEPFPGIAGIMIGRAFVRALGEGEGSRERLARYLAASEAELSGPGSVLGRMKELLSYWKDLPAWRRRWNVIKLARSVDEFRLAAGLKRAILAAVVAWTAVASAQVWDFTTGEVPAGGVVREHARLVAGEGLCACDATNVNWAAGYRMSPAFAYPPAFRLTFEVVVHPLDGVLSRSNHLWDDMYVNYSPKWLHRGLQIILWRYGDSSNVKVYVGFGDSTVCYNGNSFTVRDGDVLHIAVDYHANRLMSITCNGVVTRHVLPVATPILKSRYDLTCIGDRLYSWYQPFEGFVRRVSAEPLPYQPAYVFADGRTVFERGERDASCTLVAGNAGGTALTDARLSAFVTDAQGALVRATTNLIGTLAAGGATNVPMEVETRLCRGAKRLTCVLDGRSADGDFAVTNSCDLTIAPCFAPRMPVVAWGFGDAAVATNFGFTHGTASLGFDSPLSSSTNRRQPVDALDAALKSGFRLIRSCGVVYPEERADGGSVYRFRRDGSLRDASKPKNAVEVSQTEVQEYAYRVAADNASVYGAHPAFGGLLAVSEYRDMAYPSFNLESVRYRRESGEFVPDGAEGRFLTSSVAQANRRFPTGIVPEDDPYLGFYRWYWGGGDGWPAYSGALADGFRTGLGRQPFFSFFDPAVRCPAVWGSGGSVDVLNQWCYANPDPMNVAGPLESMFAMAEGRPGQDVMMMTQVICYRTQTSPTNVVLQTTPDWARRFPRAQYPSIAPDSLQEAVWSMLAKPVRGIMFHGWGCYVDTGEEDGYCFTNTNTPVRLRHLLREVVAPLGPTLLELGRDTPEVAVLESGTTTMMCAAGAQGWAYPAVSLLQRARLDPRVVYEESLVAKGLPGAKVLYVPNLRFTTQRVVDRIAAFRAGGGLVVADSNTLAAVGCDYRTPSVSNTSTLAADRNEAADELLTGESSTVNQSLKTLNAHIVMTNEAEKLRIRLAALGYAAKTGSSSPEIIVYNRTWGATPYLFAINDRRRFGDYFGPWGRTMEQGLPNAGAVTVDDPNGAIGAVYELSRGGECAFARAAGRVSVPVRFETNDGRLFVFLKERIASVSLDVPPRVEAGEQLLVSFTVRGLSGDPVAAALPVEIRVRDRAGTELDGAGYAVAKGGVCRLAVPTGLDDPPGGYRIVARDRASGLEAAADVACAPAASGARLTVPAGETRTVRDADVATFAALDALTVDGTLVLTNLTDELCLRARLAGGGRLVATAATGGVVFAADNSAYDGEMTFEGTPVTVLARHGLGSPSRAIVHKYARLLFKGEGLVNDVPLILFGSRTGASALTESAKDALDLRGRVTWRSPNSTPKVELGNVTFSGGQTGESGSYTTYVPYGCTVSVEGVPMDFSPRGSCWQVYDLAAGARFHIRAAGTKTHDDRFCFRGDGTVLCGTAGAFGSGTLGLGGQGVTTLDLNGFDQRLDTLANCIYPWWSTSPTPTFRPTRGCEGCAVVTSSRAATLELCGANVATTAVKFVRHASLAFSGKGRFAMVNQRSTTDGTLTVRSGIVSLDWNAGWDGDVVIAGSGRLCIAADSSLHPEGLSTLTFADNGRLVLTGGVVRCSRLCGPFGEKGVGVYGKDDLGGALVGKGRIAVIDAKAMGNAFVWTGAAGGDSSVTNAANWKYGRRPAFDGSDVLVFTNTTAATRATLPDGRTSAYGIVFDTASNFSLDAPSGVTLDVGLGGLTSRAPPVASKIVTNTLNVAVRPAQPLANWTPAAGTAFEYRGGLVMPAEGDTFTLAGAGFHVFSHPCDRLKSSVTVTTPRVKFTGAGLTNALSLVMDVGSLTLADSLISRRTDPLVLNGRLNWSHGGCRYFHVGRETVFNGGIGPTGSPAFNTSGGAADLFLTNAPIRFTSTTYVLFQDGVTVHLGAPAGEWKYLGTAERIVCANTNVLAGGHVFFGIFRNYGNGTIDLNGHDQDLASIARYDIRPQDPEATAATTAFGTLASASPATARLTRATGTAGVYPLRVTGAVTLEQAGGATNAIVNQKSPTAGALVVSGGALQFLWGAGFTNVTDVTVASGLLKVDAASAATAFGEREGTSRARMRIAYGGRLEIESGTATVRTLHLGNRSLRPGSYGSPDNASVPVGFRLSALTGDGILRVLDAPGTVLLIR